MNRLILTTLNNNDEIWYRCFIPFILSLRKTNFSGDIGVINYQLSNEKKEVLLKNNIKIFDASNSFSELLIDRHISTAHIAEKYNYEQIALYDSDIWFSRPYLTLFDRIEDNNSLYCSFDVIYPQFLTYCLPLEKQKQAKNKFDSLYQKNNYLWQAGVMLGTQQAWKNYHHYIVNDLKNLAQFSMVYGVDAAILNLYAHDKNNIKHLPEKYNCLPLWGIQRVHKPNSNADFFSVQNDIIEGIHVTRYHRDSKEYNYTHLHKQTYLDEGKAFCLNKASQSFNAENHFSKLQKYSMNIFSVEEIEYSGLTTYVDIEGIIYQKHSTIVDFTGNSRLSLKNIQDKELEITFLYQELYNRKFPIFCNIYINDKHLNLEKNKQYKISIPPYGKITFISHDLWDDIGVRYIFKNVTIL